jgi:hypothetical protein
MSSVSSTGFILPVGNASEEADLEQRRQVDRRAEGADVAVVLDRFFARSDASLEQLVTDVGEMDVPIDRNDHIAAAALRADGRRVRETGRWLVRHSTNRQGALVGLARHVVPELPLTQFPVAEADDSE